MKVEEVFKFIQRERVVCKESIAKSLNYHPGEISVILDLLSSQGLLNTTSMGASCSTEKCSGCVSFCAFPGRSEEMISLL